MTHDPLSQHLSTFNFNYLSLLQRHLLIDPLQARYAFDLQEDIAALLTTLSGEELLALSHSHRALCRLTLNNASHLRRRIKAPSHLHDAHKAHAAILNLKPQTHPADQDITLWGSS